MQCDNIHNWYEQFLDQKAIRQDLIYYYWCMGVQVDHLNYNPTNKLLQVLEKIFHQVNDMKTCSSANHVKLKAIPVNGR
jgi:hypothetical protein